MITFALIRLHGIHVQCPQEARKAVRMHTAFVGITGIAIIPAAVAFTKSPNVFLASVLGLLALIAAANATFAAEARRLQKGGQR